MGGEWGVGASLAMESIPPRGARLRLGPAAVGLSHRLPARLARLPALPVHRLARDVLRRGRARPARPLHLPPRAGIAELQRRGGQDGRKHPGGAEVPLAARDLRHPADDGVQFLQPRHPGPLSDLPAESSTISVRHGEHIAHHRQSRRDPGRDLLRHAVRADRAAAHDRAGRPACAAGDLRSGPFPPPRALAARRLPDAGLVQGAWGVVPAHLERAVAGRRARAPSRASSISSAICSPPPRRPCRRSSPQTRRGTTAWRWRWSPGPRPWSSPC